MPGIFPSIEQRKKRIYNLERERDGTGWLQNLTLTFNKTKRTIWA